MCIYGVRDYTYPSCYTSSIQCPGVLRDDEGSAHGPEGRLPPLPVPQEDEHDRRQSCLRPGERLVPSPGSGIRPPRSVMETERWFGMMMMMIMITMTIMMMTK